MLIDKIAAWLADAVESICNTRVWFGDVMLVGTCTALAIALLICIWRDEPLWYYTDKSGNTFKYTIRHGKCLVKERND